MIHDTPRGSRHDMGFLLQSPDLFVNGESPEYRRNLQALLPPYMKHFLADLNCQLSRRLQHQGLRCVFLPPDILADRYGKRRRLSASCGGFGHYIFSCKHGRNHFLLYVCGFFISKAV